MEQLDDDDDGETGSFMTLASKMRGCFCFVLY